MVLHVVLEFYAKSCAQLDGADAKWSIRSVKSIRSAGLGLAAILLLPSLGAAQPMEVRNDDIRIDSEAYISCGFCAGEKFGALFYDPVLPTATFPLTLSKIKVALASITVVQSGGGFICEPGAGGMLNVSYEAYAGTSVPSSITALPQNGIWPGETILMPLTSVPITLSEPTSPGASDYRLNLNEIPINGVTVPPPHTYIRVVFTIPTGAVQSASCSALGLGPPGGVSFRDTDITGRSRRNFIYQIDPTNIVGDRWVFNEAFIDPVSGSNINGDWIIRLEVESTGGGTAGDAGVAIGQDATPNPPADSGPQTPADSGAAVPDPDSGIVINQDAGSGSISPPPAITAITPTEGAFNTNIPVVILGSGFVSGASARLGQISLSGVEVPGLSTLKAIVPPGIAAGVYDVIVENPDGQIALLKDGFAVTNGNDSNVGRPPAESSCSCKTQSSAHDDIDAYLFFGMLAGALLIRRRKRSHS